MAKLTLDYPVYSPDRELLLPAGTILAKEDFCTPISLCRDNFQKRSSLMKLGTVRKDILGFIRQPPGNSVFRNKKDISDIMKLMETTQLAQSGLDSIKYFKEYDSYTYRHILMVFALSALLAKDLVPDYQVRIREAGTSPLHDIGKVCVPLKILKKESPLTRDERKHVEHHTIAGYILLSYYSQNVNDIAARVARDHHERKNGSGYPQGMVLNDPLVEAVAVCDIYDALISNRPYRPVAFDNRAALENITMMAERNEVGWEVVKALIAHNRKENPHFTECRVSLEKRGTIPQNNAYGILSD
jgi:HD-GYP domain-containing protein (c-di-GMP phosphodiesterase class II)